MMRIGEHSLAEQAARVVVVAVVAAAVALTPKATALQLSPPLPQMLLPMQCPHSQGRSNPQPCLLQGPADSALPDMRPRTLP